MSKRFSDVEVGWWCLIGGHAYQKLIEWGHLLDRYGAYNTLRPNGEHALVYPWIRVDWAGDKLNESLEFIKFEKGKTNENHD